MSETQQPVWKHVASIGDVDPIVHGGGFIYEDETGVYCPEMSLIEPSLDVGNKVTIYRILLERNPENEWWWSRLNELSSFVDLPVPYLIHMARCSFVEQGNLYNDLCRFFGYENFDTEPVVMSEDEAYAKYKEEVDKKW